MSTSFRCTWLTSSPCACSSSSGFPPPNAEWPVSKQRPSSDRSSPSTNRSISRGDSTVTPRRGSGTTRGSRVRGTARPRGARSRGAVRIARRRARSRGAARSRPAKAQALGLAERVRDQDRRPGITSARLVQQLERLVEIPQVGLDVLAARESQREERAHQHEPARPQRVGDGRAVAEVARRPELAARVAGSAIVAASTGPAGRSSRPAVSSKTPKLTGALAMRGVIANPRRAVRAGPVRATPTSPDPREVGIVRGRHRADVSAGSSGSSSRSRARRRTGGSPVGRSPRRRRAPRTPRRARRRACTRVGRRSPRGGRSGRRRPPRARPRRAAPARRACAVGSSTRSRRA